MVAAARQDVGLTVRGIVGAMIALLVLLPANCFVADTTDTVNRSGLKDEPAVLAAEARRLMSDQFGYGEPPDDETYDEIYGLDIVDGTVKFWFRQRFDRPFVTQHYWSGWGVLSRVRPNWRDPRWEVPGERGLVLDTAKRLQSFRALPPEEASATNTSPDPDWSAWFPPETTGMRLAIDDDGVDASEAGKPSPMFTPVIERFRTPPDAFDAVGVWTGADPDSGEQIDVEAAAFRGRPTYFRVLSQQEVDDVQWWGRNIVVGLALCLSVAGVVLAWQNLHSGRGDRRGALRLAGCVFCLETAVWLTHTRHVADLDFENGTVITIGLSQVLYATANAWVWYIALEPFARRIWPRVLISWSRLLDGRWRNPLIGRDLLLGALAGVCATLLARLNLLVQMHLTETQPHPLPTNALTLDGTKELLGVALECFSDSIRDAMFMLLLLVLLRITLRTERRAIVGSLIIATTWLTLFIGGNLVVTGILVLLFTGLQLTVLVRLGFLALVVVQFASKLFIAFPLTADASHWYFSHGLFAMAWVIGLALFGCYTLLGGRSGLAHPATSP